jgi:hypothetical protein
MRKSRGSGLRAPDGISGRVVTPLGAMRNSTDREETA